MAMTNTVLIFSALALELPNAARRAKAPKTQDRLTCDIHASDECGVGEPERSGDVALLRRLDIRVGRTRGVKTMLRFGSPQVTAAHEVAIGTFAVRLQSCEPADLRATPPAGSAVGRAPRADGRGPASGSQRGVRKWYEESPRRASQTRFCLGGCLARTSLNRCAWTRSSRSCRSDPCSRT